MNLEQVLDVQYIFHSTVNTYETVHMSYTLETFYDTFQACLPSYESFSITYMKVTIGLLFAYMLKKLNYSHQNSK